MEYRARLESPCSGIAAFLSDYRHRQSTGRGSDFSGVELEEDDLVIEAPSDDLLTLDEALSEFESIDGIKAELVK